MQARVDLESVPAVPVAAFVDELFSGGEVGGDEGVVGEEKAEADEGEG